MTSHDLFSKGFPTNRIQVKLPSTGQSIILRETTVIELKSMAKTVIDNISAKQMDAIYEATTDYLRAMIITDGVDVDSLTEFDRLFCLMVFFQKSFYKDPITHKCPHCGVDIVYRYDMSKYLQKMETAYVEPQTVQIPYKSKTYEFVIGWPTVDTMTRLMRHFYSELGPITEEIERAQFGINFVLSFIRKITVIDSFSGERETEVDLEGLDDFQSRLECINLLPSMIVLDENTGVFGQITGYFINRLENCFTTELCPQCHRDTNYGIPQSSLFYGLLYGSIKSLYGFIIQVECFLLFRYDSFIFEEEKYLTYNDLSTLIHQLSTTIEKDNKERQKMSKDMLYKGLWYIREILNTMVFPQDKKH